MSEVTIKHPLLESLLTQRGMKLKAIYSIRDAAQLFQVTTRTIQDWVSEGKMTCRDLPGRGRFLSEDLEAFLQGSRRTHGVNPSDKESVGMKCPPVGLRERRIYGK